METIGIRFKENEDPVLTKLQQLLMNLQFNKKQETNLNKIRRKFYSTSTPLNKCNNNNEDDDHADSIRLNLNTRLGIFSDYDRRSLKMSADVFNLLDGTRSSKRKPAPLPPVSPYSSRESRHVLASELTQCDVKGWLVDEVRGLNVWVVVADMLFCVFDSDESEISRNVVMLPGCRIRPVIFKSAPPDVTDKTSAPAKTITGIDKYQFLIDDVSTKRKLLFGVSNRNDLDMWLDVLIEAVSMDLTFDATPRCSSDSCVPNEECFPALDANSSYLPSPNIPRRSTISHFDNSLLKNGHTTSLIDIRRRMKRDNDTVKPQLQQTPLKATHDSINTPILAKKKGLFVNLKSFGSLDSLLKRPKRSRSADDSEIPERRSLDETKHYTPPSPSDSDGSSASCSAVHSRFPVIETGSVSKGIGPVVRRRVSDIKDKFFNEGTPFCGAPGVKLNELFAEKMSGFLQYRVMMKWIKVWCIVARGCFYGFKSQDPDETPIVAVVLKQCMVSYETGPVKANKEQYILKLSQPHCKSIYLSALSDKDLKRWLHQLKIESCGVQADDNISIENSSECTQSYDSAFSNVSMASSQNEFNDKLNQAGANGNTDGSPPHDDVFHNDYSPEEWDTYSNDSQNDTISELHDPFSRPEPMLTLSARKEKGYLLQAIRSKFKMVRKKNLPEPIMERELSFPEGGDILMLDGDDTSGKYKKGSVADIRRSKSFSAQTLSKMSSDSESESSGSHNGIKIHKPMCVKTIPVDEITDPTLQGYLERRNINGQWIRYWFILKDCSLYCYLTQHDRVTVDIILLQDYSVSSLVDRFRGKRFVILLSHEEYLPLYISTETLEELETWLEVLQSVSDPASESRGACGLIIENGSLCNNDQTEMFRQKLLEEVLRQKEMLELQLAERHKKMSASSNDLQPFGGLHDGDEQICQMTRLKQRRMSTQIKMDTLQKQLLTTNGNKKSLFNFGKKKSTEGHNPYVIEQLKELSQTMHLLNKDLDQNGNCNTRSKLAQSQASKSFDCIDDYVDKSAVHRSNSLKSSMQKLAHKTFIKASWNKRRKSRNMQSNSSLDSDESHSSLQSDSDFVDLTKSSRERSASSDRLGVNCDWSVSSDSDLNRSSLCLSQQSSCEHSPRSPRDNPMSFDLTAFKRLDNVDGSCTSSSYLDCSNACKRTDSPRREINPSVLAEIEEFEEMTRQALGRMTIMTTSS